jgi:hypothetical protein
MARRQHTQKPQEVEGAFGRNGVFLPPLVRVLAQDMPEAQMDQCIEAGQHHPVDGTLSGCTQMVISRRVRFPDRYHHDPLLALQ